MVLMHRRIERQRKEIWENQTSEEDGESKAQLTLCLVLVASLALAEASFQPASRVGPLPYTLYIAAIFDNNAVVHYDVCLTSGIISVLLVVVVVIAH
jgi:hypothetical protein